MQAVELWTYVDRDGRSRSLCPFQARLEQSPRVESSTEGRTLHCIGVDIIKVGYLLTVAQPSRLNQKKNSS